LPAQERILSDYVFTMYRADKYYGPDRQVLANISLSFLPGAKIGVLGPNSANVSSQTTAERRSGPPAAGLKRGASRPQIGLPLRAFFGLVAAAAPSWGVGGRTGGGDHFHGAVVSSAWTARRTRPRWRPKKR